MSFLWGHGKLGPLTGLNIVHSWEESNGGRDRLGIFVEELPLLKIINLKYKMHYNEFFLNPVLI